VKKPPEGFGAMQIDADNSSFGFTGYKGVALVRGLGPLPKICTECNKPLADDKGGTSCLLSEVWADKKVTSTVEITCPHCNAHLVFQSTYPERDDAAPTT